MLKKYEPKFSVGSLFICSKCGQTFADPAGDFAEQLKKDLRLELKELDSHKKVRVMVSGCLGVCENNEQAFAFYPNVGSVEINTTQADYTTAHQDLLNFIKSKTHS